MPIDVPKTAVLAVGALAAAVALTGSIAVAASSAHSVHACARKSSGALRIAKKCSHKEKGYTLGAKGPAGAKGVTGDRGPSDGYVDTMSSLQPVGNEPTVLASLALPAGSYTFVGSIGFQNTSTTASVQPFCYFVAGSLNSAISVTFVPAKVAAGPTAGVGEGNIVLTSGITLPAATTLYVMCQGPATTTLEGYSSLTANRVATLHTVGEAFES